MCRWLAYSGAPIHLEEAIFRPEHSLIDQSLNARQGETTTNGDGFGIGWYGNRDFPGVYRDIQPAWNDANLQALAAQIESRLFFAHIRAATGTAVQRTNCHPFRYGCWLFVHNGSIGGFDKIKRDLVLAVAPELYNEIRGTTDSEIMFFLALTFGMADDVLRGVARMVGFVEATGTKHGIEHPMQMALGISDGGRLYGFRYSTEGRSRTLFHSADIEAVREIVPGARRFSSDARAVVSEPLTDMSDVWIGVPESSWLTVDKGEIRIEDFVPQMP